MSRRDFLRATAGSAGLILFAACVPAGAPAGQQTQEQPGAEGKTTIQWWHGWSGMTGIAAMQAVADAFNEQSDDIFVERLQVEDVHEKYLTAIAGGAPPDCEIGNLNYSEFWARGVLLPMDDWMASCELIELEDIIQAALDGAKWHGVTYGVPCIESSVRFALSYNAKLIEDAGLDPNSPPQTWDEVFEWHKAATRFDSAGNIEVLGFDPMDAMGGSGPGPPDPFFWPPSFDLAWWDGENNAFHFDDDKFVAILQTINMFYEHAGVEKMAGYRSSYGTWTQSPTASFPAQVQAMIVNGPWQPGELAHSSPDGNFIYTWGPTPGDRKGVKFQSSGGHYGSIPQGAKNPELAFKFLEFCTQNEVQDIVFDQTGWLGPRISWNQKLDVSTYAGLEFYITSITEADELRPSEGCPISNFVGNQWTTNVDAVNFGDKTPEQAAADMQKLCTDELHNQFPEL
jgi:ABC-type glycerol-3-phosphate transport system substrate-binding protein